MNLFRRIRDDIASINTFFEIQRQIAHLKMWCFYCKGRRPCCCEKETKCEHIWRRDVNATVIWDE